MTIITNQPFPIVQKTQNQGLQSRRQLVPSLVVSYSNIQTAVCNTT